MSVTEIAIAAAAAVSLLAYGALIVRPAWASYGRLWERVAASFLTLYILAALVGLGAALGLAIFWGYLNAA